MYIKRTIGHVANPQRNVSNTFEKSFDRQPYHQVVKTGRVLTSREEVGCRFNKSATIASIANQGHDYYQVISNQGACEECQEHNGAIYPVIKEKDGENLPPFHPNCKCTIQGFTTQNPNHDPWLAETLFWLDIMYGDGSMEQKAQKLLDFYRWTEFSVEFIAQALSAIDGIKHIGKRMEAFFERLENPSAVAIITPADLKEFGWHTATQDEADRLMEAFVKFGITSRESMIQFIAIAAAESGYGLNYLEGEFMTREALLQYLSDKDYDIYERGAGYIQVTYREDHLAFLEFMGDSFKGEDTASYIAENYPLEVSVWYWTRKGYWDGGNNEFIDVKMGEGGDPTLIFLKTAYYCGGMYNPKDFPDFNSDINAAIAGEADFTMTDTTITINGRIYTLPSRWKERLEAYEKAQTIW